METSMRHSLFSQAVSHYTTKTGWLGGRNWTEAAHLFQILVEENVSDEIHGEALCYLGDMCRVGKNKIAKDEQAAVIYYTRAIQAQNGRAMIALGDMYANRLGGLIGGPQEAESLYLLAQAGNVPEASSRLEALRATVASRDEFAAIRSTISIAMSGMHLVKALTSTHEARIAALEEKIHKLEQVISECRKEHHDDTGAPPITRSEEVR